MRHARLSINSFATIFTIVNGPIRPARATSYLVPWTNISKSKRQALLRRNLDEYILTSVNCELDFFLNKSK